MSPVTVTDRSYVTVVRYDTTRHGPSCEQLQTETSVTYGAIPTGLHYLKVHLPNILCCKAEKPQVHPYNTVTINIKNFKTVC